jgi:hypothetical protein
MTLGSRGAFCPSASELFIAFRATVKNSATRAVALFGPMPDLQVALASAAGSDNLHKL